MRLQFFRITTKEAGREETFLVCEDCRNQFYPESTRIRATEADSPGVCDACNELYFPNFRKEMRKVKSIL